MQKKFRLICLFVTGFVFFSLLVTSLPVTTRAAVLSPGDIAFVEMNTDNPDSFKFLVLTDISGGSTVNFTDNGWENSGTWRANEGVLIWTAPAGGVSCGSVVEIEGTTSASDGTVSSSGSYALSTEGDQIIAYEDTDWMIAALNNEGAAVWQSDATDANTSAVPQGLTNGTNAVAIQEIDNAMYDGSLLSGTKAELLAAINDASNWVGSSSSRQDFQSTFTVTDCGSTDTAPAVSSTSPSNGATGAATNTDITINFNESVDLTDNAVTLNCGGAVSFSGLPANNVTSVTLTPSSDLPINTICTVTVVANQVTDNDVPVDEMSSNYEWSFATYGIVINEINADPDATNGDANGDGSSNYEEDEFVEIYNDTGGNVDISGWTLLDGYGVRHTFPSGSVITDQCSVLVFGGGTPTGTFGNSIVQTATSGALGFNNSGDSVTLSNGSGNIVAESYGSEGGDNQSLTRDPDISGSFIQHSSATGAGGALFSPGTMIDGSSFSGCADTAPTIQSLNPADGASEVSLATDLVATFNENVQKGTGNITLRLAADDSVVEAIDVTSGQVTVSGADVTIDPTADLVNNTDYYVQIDTGAIEDTSGNDFAGISDTTTWNFSTSPLRIYHIQGNGPSSSMVGSTVTVNGTVVGDFQGSDELSGFFIQDATGDGDVTTSDGIFVYVPEANTTWYGTDVQTGQEVQVTGRVNEYNTFTEIDFVTDITIINASLNPLLATPVTLPETTDGDLERYEGMLITFNSSLTVVQNYFLGRYGQMTLSGSGRLFQPTNQFAPGSAAAVALADLNARSWLFLDDGSDTENPATVPYLGGPPPAVIRAGDTVTGLTGVLDYGYINSSGGRDYRIHPIVNPSFTNANARTSAPGSIGGSVRVASFNVLNYFVTLDSGSNICGPSGGQECRGADSSSEFSRQRDKIIAAMCAIDADVFGLMELENINPNNDPNPGDGISNYVLLDLVNGLNDAGSACPDKSYDFVDSGPTGTDAIQVGIIYKTSTMTAASGLVVLDDAAFLDPNNLGSSKNRPAQALAFENSSGERFSVVVNHLKSKGSSCGAGDDDLTTGQGNCNLTRTLAAAYQRDWIATDPTGSGDADYIVLGDLNAYAQEDPIMAFNNNGFLNLIETFEGSNAYSFIFDGQSGYLDHVIAHSSFPAQVTGVTEWHINADEPSVIDYDEYWNPAGYYSATPYRASDHDPVIIGLDLQPKVTGTINGIVEGVTHNFPNGICGSITFTTLGSVDHVEVAYRQSHPSINSDGLPRGYEIRAFDIGNNEVTTGFVADVMMCYADIELGLASIDSSEEPNLHAYRYAGSDTWQEYSVVDTINNTVTAEAVTALGNWGLGIGAEQPTVISLQNFNTQTKPMDWLPVLVLLAGFGAFSLWGWRCNRKGKHTT